MKKNKLLTYNNKQIFVFFSGKNKKIFLSAFLLGLEVHFEVGYGLKMHFSVISFFSSHAMAIKISPSSNISENLSIFHFLLTNISLTLQRYFSLFQKGFRSSTCPLTSFFWLLSHVSISS